MLILFQTADKKQRWGNKGQGREGPGQHHPCVATRSMHHLQRGGPTSAGPQHHLAKVGLDWCWSVIQSSF